MKLPDRALSIRQPWAWLVATGRKEIENRPRAHPFRGEFLIHASLTADRDALFDVFDGAHPVTGEDLDFVVPPLELHRGGYVGIAEVVDCVTTSDSPWFVGPFGFVIRNARPIEFIPAKGMLGFYGVKLP